MMLLQLPILLYATGRDVLDRPWLLTLDHYDNLVRVPQTYQPRHFYSLAATGSINKVLIGEHQR